MSTAAAALQGTGWEQVMCIGCPLLRGITMGVVLFSEVSLWELSSSQRYHYGSCPLLRGITMGVVLFSEVSL